PARMPSTSPVSLIRVDGIYENRTNEREAQRVCELVRELLDQKKPPSIGIACFNVSQRDLIAERLDELALHDEKFAAKLADARSRSDEGEFRGLFVKNLENVQGDERDHIIISTTYGPDPKGRFYRRFGPLGMAGGGRRLNVLVTRAKERVHVVTSIPRSQYETLPPIPEGQNAAGGWLLFAYLQFADRLTDAFAAIEPAKNTATLFGAMPHGGDVKHPSRFAAALAQQLAANGGQAASPWGNDGFCIDVAYQRSGAQQAAHSGNGATNGNGAARSRLAADDVLGVLCDFNRYKGSDDPVDWEIYRTGIFNMLGWQCRRVWTPTFVRDAEGVVKTLVER
ncbi:MAG: AAA domain-containing protein, partial [Phycisphaerae bacterium]